MEKKEFRTESKKILDLMVNSVYTHKEIFLREIISNASDALDKLAYIALTDDKVGLTNEDFNITILPNEDERTLTVADNGIGMTYEELENNLGVIARSGSQLFKSEISKNGNTVPDIIGQFGVGFYSSFMVSQKVTVLTRAYGSNEAYLWESEGVDGYTITPAQKDSVGTEVRMYLKDDTEDENYSEYLEYYTLRRLIKKYSDYIRFKILMDVPKTRTIESDEVDEDGKKKTTYESYTEREVINSRVPLWKRSKEEASDEECFAFFKDKYFEREDPLLCIRENVQGLISYRAMLFVPSSIPHGYFTKEFEKGLSLYSSGVMIIDKCADLLPEHFRFVKGVVDSDDLSLNISRELLQQDRQLKVIATSLEKRIKRELKRLLEEDREKYEKFFHVFGLQLKYGIVNDFGTHKDLLSDLLLFYSSKKQAMITLDEYVADMPEDQKYIYFACGDSHTLIESLPQTERIRDKGWDILSMTDDIDRFVAEVLEKVGEKELRSADSDDAELVSDEEKEQTEKAAKESKDLLDFIEDSLDGGISAARISQKLRSHAVFLTAEGGITLEMEKYFAQIPGEQKPKAERVLELNPNHSAFLALKSAFEGGDKDKAARMAKVLYGQALLIAGLDLENPTEFSELVSSFLS